MPIKLAHYLQQFRNKTHSRERNHDLDNPLTKPLALSLKCPTTKKLFQFSPYQISRFSKKMLN